MEVKKTLKNENLLAKHSLRNSYKGDFNGKWAKDTLLSSLLERLIAFWTPHMTGYLMEPIKGNKDSKRTPHERPKMLKLHKRSFSKEPAVQTPILQGQGRDCSKHLIFLSSWWNQWHLGLHKSCKKKWNKGVVFKRYSSLDSLFSIIY